MTSPILIPNGHYQEPTGISLTDTFVTGSNVSPQSSTFTKANGNDAAVIPPEHSNRTLIVCFDGTGDQFGSDNSNIVQLVSLLKKDDSTKQLVYYQAGIGTYTSPEIATPFMSRIRKTFDEMFALNIHAHVMSGYEFLMQNYIAGDKISLFGFSRGAYTARSLAGMLHKVGLLPPGNFQQVPFAYKMYTRADSVGWEQSNEFKKAFSVDVPIDFIGVWDTVDAVGLFPKRLPFTTSNTIVRTFRHALSLDERRARFKANLWNRPNAKEVKLGIPQHPRNVEETRHDLKYRTSIDNSVALKEDTSEKKKKKLRKEDEDDRALSTFESIYSKEGLETKTDVEEVWFSGCHCDIGGGSVSNKTRHSLARITLRWMVRECFKTNTGIMFNCDALLDIGLDPSTLHSTFIRPAPRSVASHYIKPPPEDPIPIGTREYLFKKKHHSGVQNLIKEGCKPFLGSEEEEELHDAMSPKYDQLRMQKMWWLLEILPLKLRYQRGNTEWVSYIGSNMGGPRFIPKQKTNGFKVHRSVKMRMEAQFEDEIKRREGKRYIPKPIFKTEPTWVD